MAGTLPDPAGDPALPGARCRPVQAALRHLVQHARGGRGLRRGGQPLACAHRPRRRAVGAVPGHGYRLPVGADHPADRRRGLVRRPHLPHRPLAARGSGLRRSAGGNHRHRFVGGAGDPGDRRAGPPAGGVPAHRPVLGAGAQPAGRSRTGGRDQGRLCRLSRPQPAHAQRPALAPAAQRFLGALGGCRRARTHLRAALAGGRIPVLRQLQRPHGQRTGQRRGGGVRARQDPRPPCATRAVAELLCPAHTIACKRPVLDSGYFEAFNRRNVLLVDIQSAPIRDRSRQPACAPHTRTTNWTASSSPPGSTA